MKVQAAKKPAVEYAANGFMDLDQCVEQRFQQAVEFRLQLLKAGSHRSGFCIVTLAARRRQGRLPVGMWVAFSLLFSCAVKRRWSTVGESPTRELVRSTR